jgi:hypothetical protein
VALGHLLSGAGGGSTTSLPTLGRFSSLLMRRSFALRNRSRELLALRGALPSELDQFLAGDILEIHAPRPLLGQASCK